MDIVHNHLPKGEDPHTILSFENDAKIKLTISFEGEFAPLVDYTDDEGVAKMALTTNIFGLVYAAFGGEVPADAESDDGETA